MFRIDSSANRIMKLSEVRFAELGYSELRENWPAMNAWLIDGALLHNPAGVASDRG
ncbi:hypothetical protein [Variovorax gossypii]